MSRILLRSLLGFLLLVGAGMALPAADPTRQPPAKAIVLPDLSEYRTVENAVVTTVAKGPAQASSQGYLGIHVTSDRPGELVVAAVEPESAAAQAGLQAGDVLVSFAGQSVHDVEAFRNALQGRPAGEAVKVAVARKGKPVEVSATLAAVSRPMRERQRAVLGVLLAETPKDGGVAVDQVDPGSPAAVAGLKAGDVVLKIDDKAVTTRAALREVLGQKNPGDTVALTYKRDGKTQDVKVKLAADDSEDFRGRFRGGPSGLGGYWNKPVYRIGVVCVEYPDVKHNAKVTRKNWQEALFSRKTYAGKNSPTGQPVFGSLNDYYEEQSFGNLRVEGEVFSWVEVSKKRGEYGQTEGTRFALLTEALDKLLARDGADALKDIDGLFFMYAGDVVRTNRGNLYWPHRASVMHQGKRWPYFITFEGGERMATISVACHEFGHMLGLPDLYARPESPGSEGVGAWCAMSEQIGNGRPQHFCAWSKEQLGWVKPAVIDPTVKQKLILAPAEDSPRQCFKVLVKPDGSEYLLLENRRKKGFDQDLPGEGLLIWRVVGNRPVLEESHGVEGPSGPKVHLAAVPYPSASNNAFTPYTTPSSRSQLGGGLPVHITNIRCLPDGRITFQIGYTYL
jgi:M6 family metalloprotease-like protein